MVRSTGFGPFASVALNDRPGLGPGLIRPGAGPTAFATKARHSPAPCQSRILRSMLRRVALLLLAPTGQGTSRKHPTPAVNFSGMNLLAWTQGAAWNRGASIAWQLFAPNLTPVGGVQHASDSPPFTVPTTFAKPDGSRVIID